MPTLIATIDPQAAPDNLDGYCVCCGIQLVDDNYDLLTEEPRECECPVGGWCEVCNHCCDGCTCVDIEDFEDAAAQWTRRPKQQRDLFSQEPT